MPVGRIEVAEAAAVEQRTLKVEHFYWSVVCGVERTRGRGRSQV